MMNGNWKEGVELIGILAIVASLIFVGLQLRQEHAIANAQLQNEMISARIELNDQVIGNAAVLVKANNGESLTEEEQLILYELVDSHWAEGFFGYRRWQFVEHPAYLAPMRAFSNFLHENPAALRVWETMPQNLRRNEAAQGVFNELVRERIAQLRSEAQ